MIFPFFSNIYPLSKKNFSNVYSIFRKTNEMKSDLAWKREWEAKVREKARQEQARQEKRERQPKRKKAASRERAAVEAAGLYRLGDAALDI